MDAPRALAGRFRDQFHQVAIYCHDISSAVQQMKVLGYDEWTYDTATLTGMMYGQPVVKYGNMAFNYQMMPLELEYVHYSTPTRHPYDNRDGRMPFISHLSVHVEDLDAEVEQIRAELLMWPYHQFTTSEHTNEAIAGKRHFREAIYDTTRWLGFDLKLIQRVAE